MEYPSEEYNSFIVLPHTFSAIRAFDDKEEEFAVNGLGGSYAKNIANAYKGLKTSAFKNACRYLFPDHYYMVSFIYSAQERRLIVSVYSRR